MAITPENWVGATNGMPMSTPTPQFQEVHIIKVVNGFSVKIGCTTFVSQNWDKLSKALGEYWKNPEEAQKKYCK
jgi:hypothetical protein